ncbi:MAG: serine O-acetyltransferase EpsC [Myxococcota bacterium]
MNVKETPRPRDPDPPDGPDFPADPDRIAEVVRELSRAEDDALGKAATEGLPDRAGAVDWVERVKDVLLRRTGVSELRAEIPQLADGLLHLLGELEWAAPLSTTQVVNAFLPRLPAIRALLAEDVEAAYRGDPAARSFAEIVVAYPCIRAIAIQRIAHELHLLKVPVLPRMMTEYAHDRTGIDIHPGARIGRRFFIDHGTGVVIGETARIGDDVRIYQGVTLGARAPRLGESLRGCKRHPDIEDRVTLYAGTTVLGGDTVIGRDSVIGGNVWLTESVPPESRVVAEAPRARVRRRGADEGSVQLGWEL